MLESEALARAAQRATAGERLVVATGGGIVLAPANRDLLRAMATVYLRASPASLLPRLAGNARRPLLREDPAARIERLHAERDLLYAEVATHVLAADGWTVARMVDRIAGWLEARPAHLPESPT